MEDKKPCACDNFCGEFKRCQKSKNVADGDSSTNVLSISSSKFSQIHMSFLQSSEATGLLSFLQRIVGKRSTILKLPRELTLKENLLYSTLRKNSNHYLYSVLRKIRDHYRHHLPASVATIQKEPHDSTLKPTQSQDSNLSESLTRGAPYPPVCTLPPFPRTLDKIQVSPMVQVFSVAIHPHFDDSRPYQIYGNIGVEEDDDIVPIYDKKRDDPEVISSCGGNLTLIDKEKPDFIGCRMGPASVFLNLTDEVRGLTLFNNRKVTLHPEGIDIEESCDKPLTTTVQGDHGYACIYYAEFLHAVTAHVRISILCLDDTTIDVDCPPIEVYGSVVARYGNAKRVCTDDQVEHMKTTLFNKPSHQPQKVKIGSCINLTRCLVALPAYDSLIIEVDLNFDGGVARGSATFLPDGRFEVTQVLPGVSFAVQVQVKWDDGYRRLINNDCDLSEVKYGFGPKPHGVRRGEVFSVYVAGINQDVSSVCGEISVNECNQWNMFDRSLKDPHKFTTDKMIATLECHDRIEGCDFEMKMDLKDPDNKLELSNGLIVWNDLDYLCGKYSYYDRALCSMVYGSDGYAVVHYMIYNYACMATVEISIFRKKSSSTDPVMVWGSVSASSSNFNYSTAYLKKYYQSRLFDKSPAESIQLPLRSKIPLSKSMLAVSSYGSLVIEVYFEAMSMDSTISDVISGTEQLEIDFGETSYRIVKGEHYDVELSVEFGY